jgi:hypothetical protein
MPRVTAPVVGTGVKLFIGFVLVWTIASLFSTENTFVSIIPLLIVLLCYLMVALPLRAHLYTLVFLACLSDATPISLPDKAGVWLPPFYIIYKLLFDNLNTLLPIPALRFSLTDLIYMLCLALIVIRTAMKIRIDSRARERSTWGLYALLLVVFLAVACWGVYGVIVKHGDFKQALWQTRQMMWLPFVIALCSYTLRDPRDFMRAINLMIVATCIKTLIAVRFFFGVARPLDFEPPTLTSHFDSVLMVVAFMALLIRFLHGATWKNLGIFLVVGGWIMLGIVLNNRRLAFVNIPVGIVVVMIMLRGPVKKAMKKISVFLLPLLWAYVMVGQNSTKTIFKPARQMMSVSSQDDRSSGTRDIENFNLIWTIKPNKVLGAGWGHEYVEFVRADDISQYFGQYRFIAHNSVLWLFTVGGLVGFTIMWMPVVIGIFFARRAYTFARSSLERSTAALSLVMLTTYMMQAWGDMGVMGLTSTLTAALAIAMSAKLCVMTGAFPARVNFFTIRHARSPVEATVNLPSLIAPPRPSVPAPVNATALSA